MRIPLTLAVPFLKLYCTFRLFLPDTPFFPFFLTVVRPTSGLKALCAYSCSFLNQSLASLTCLGFCFLVDSTNTLVFSFVKRGPQSRRVLPNSDLFSFGWNEWNLSPNHYEIVLLLRLKNEVCKIAQRGISHTADTQ